MRLSADALRNSDLLWSKLSTWLGERYSQNAVLHISLNLIILQNATLARNILLKKVNQIQNTFTPCGSCNVLENFPNLRSRTAYPLSSCSAEILFSTDTTSRPFWISRWTSSFFEPGNSNVAVTRFFSLSSCRSILCFVLVSNFGLKKPSVIFLRTLALNPEQPLRGWRRFAERACGRADRRRSCALCAGWIYHREGGQSRSMARSRRPTLYWRQWD